MNKSLVWSPKNLSQEHIDVWRSTLCNVQLPVEWKFLEKRFAILSVTLLRQFILFPCKSHTGKIKLNRGCISLISEYWKVAYDLQNVRQS